MDRTSEGTRARFNATFREKTAPFSLWPSLASRMRLLGILSVQAPAQSHLSPYWEGRNQTSVSTHCSLRHSFLLTQREACFQNWPWSLVCPALPTIFGFRSGVTGVVGTLRQDGRWKQTGHRELWDRGHRRKDTVSPSTHMQAAHA